MKSPTKLALYVASFIDTAPAFAERIRGYWGVENKGVARRVPPGGCLREGRRCIMSAMSLKEKMLLASGQFRWFRFGHWHAMHALNLYRDNGFDNMAQAQRRSGFGLNTLMTLFRMK